MSTLRKGELAELVPLLQSQQLRKRDLVVSPSCITMENGVVCVTDIPDDVFDSEQLSSQLEGLGVGVEGSTESVVCFEPTKGAHSQIADVLGIPRRYYQLLQDEQPELLATNVTDRFRYVSDSSGRQYLLRTLVSDDGEIDNVLRAVLSNRFKMVDHLDLLITALDSVREFSKEAGVEVVPGDCTLTDTHMHVTFTCPDIEVEAPDVLRQYFPPSRGGTKAGKPSIISGFKIGNSETGHGQWAMKPRIVELSCLNGWIQKKDAVSGIHLGSKMDEGVVTWSEDTRTKELELIQSQIGDAVKYFLSYDYLNGAVRDMSERAGEPLERPRQTVEEVCATLNYSEERANAVLDAFLVSGDHSAVGVSRAITYEAQGLDDPTEQYAVEEMAFELIESAAKIDSKLSS